MRAYNPFPLYAARRVGALVLYAVLSLALLVTPIAFTGCEIFQSNTSSLSAESSEQIILRAEQTAQTARSTFDLFVHLERDNQDALMLVSPAIHDYANNLRLHGLDWIDSLRNATKTFKANRTAENKSDLNTWIVTLTSAVTETNKYIKQAKS